LLHVARPEAAIGVPLVDVLADRHRIPDRERAVDQARHTAAGRVAQDLRLRVRLVQRYADFVEIMRTGIDPVTSKYLQVMPWPVYQDMTDRDLQAIFEYLQTIPHADPYCLGADPTKPICNP
jgi:hypothetical protein